jgi:hypothetical protein
VALIAIAADKGAPGVTTTAMALTAVWARPILLAECDPSGGDLVYRFPSAAGGHLDPRRGVLTLAIAARRGLPPQQAWEHVQKMLGGVDLLAGVTNSEQGAGLNSLWGPVGRLLAGLPQADVIADCGRLGVDGPMYDLLAEAAMILLVCRAGVADVIRLRDRVLALAAALESRRRGVRVGVLVVADSKRISSALSEVQYVLDQGNVQAKVVGGLPDDPRSAQLFRNGQIGKLNKSLLIRTARGIANQIVGALPPLPGLPASPGQPEQPDPPAPPPQPPQQLQHQPSQQPPSQQHPAQQQPPAQAWGGDPPGVLVASRRSRHGKKGQDTAPYPLPATPPSQSASPPPAAGGTPPAGQLPPMPVREQSGRG